MGYNGTSFKLGKDIVSPHNSSYPFRNQSIILNCSVITLIWPTEAVVKGVCLGCVIRGSSHVL